MLENCEHLTKGSPLLFSLLAGMEEPARMVGLDGGAQA